MSFFKTRRLNQRIKQLGLTAAIVMSAQSAWAQVYIEAECGIIGDQWITGTRVDASETVFVEGINTRTGNLTPPPAVAQGDMIEYQVTVPTAGTYDFYLLAEGEDTSGDSVFYSTDTSVWLTMNNIPNGTGFVWSFANDLNFGGTYQQIVTTGPNEVVNFYIAYREDGTLIDKLALLPAGSAVPTEPTPDGGSCFDFGDAPDTALNTNGSGDYTSLLGNTVPGPFHIVDQSPSVYLGDTAPDTENDALQNASAAGDDASDEGEAQLISTADSNAFPTITVTDTSVSFEVDVTNTKAVNATLMAWIDFDQDGLFEESERADTNPTITASAGNTQATLTWTTPTLLTGNTVARFRVSSDARFVSADDGGEDALSLGLFLDGEVEDHQITVAPDPGVCSYAAAEAVWNLDGVTTDSSGNAHNQQANTSLSSGYNSLSYASGGQSLIFNGTTDLLHYSTDSAFLEQAFTDMSVFMWILPDNPANTQIIWDEGGLTNGTAITLEGGNLVASIRESNSELNASAAYPTDGRWHHVGISWSGSDDFLRLYLDSVEVDQVATTGFGPSLSQHTSNSGIGASNADDAANITTSYAGLIDEIIYYYSDQSSNVADIANCVTPVLASDYGDALDSYGDASHEVVSSATLYLGAVTPDTEADTLLGGDAGVGADGDDGDGTDDEEADPVLTGLSSVSTGTFNVSVPVVNTGATATLAGWIDFDDDGIFQADEGALAAANASGSVDLAFDLDAVDINIGTTYARFRITRESITTADANGGFSDGEVEDYELEIVDQDYGDAPITYGEASHTVEPTLRLGSLNDIDPGTQLGGDAGAGADGDDDDGTDDEDSATPGTLSSSATDYSLTVSVNNTGGTATLYGWIDLDLDNTFDEDERTSVSVPNGTSSVDLDWSSITSSSGTSYLRLRLTRDNLTSGENPDGSSQDDVSIGSANDGEVEDYEIQIQPPICYAAYSDASITATALNLEALTPVATGRQSTFTDITTNNNDADDDNYGMIFTTELVLDSPGNFDFQTNSDDGSLLYIDGQLIVNNDDTQPPTPVTATNVALTAGTHEIVVVFHESGSGEQLTVQWTPNGTGTGLQNLINDVTPPVTCPTDPSFGMDFGDAPASYQDSGHVPSANLLLGSIQGDVDDGTQLGGDAGAGADGDDASGSNDEDSVSLPSLNNGATTYSLSVTVNNSSGNTATLYGWIDLDLNGTFDQDERVSTTVTSPTSGTVNLDWTGITPTVGTSYVRLRLTTDPLEDDANGASQDDVSFGAAADGEVEDYELIITDASEVYFEAECGVIGNNWTVRSSGTASENTFVKVNAGSDFVTLNGANEPPNDMIQYQVVVPIAGTYDLYIFSNSLNSNQNDGFHFSFDNATWTTINGLQDGNATFDWRRPETEITPSSPWQELTTTGPNEVVNVFISYRDTAFEIDKFALLSDDSAAPTEPTPAVGSCFDFGDAPDGTAGNGTGDYTTDLANTGPYHIVEDIALSTEDHLYLGSVIADTETNALDNAAATGDDSSDEGEAQLISTADGDSFPTITAADGSISFEIDVTNDKPAAATLMAWIDFDQDGLFEESERADSNPTVTASAGDTQSTLTWTTPTLISGSAVARFRLSTDPEFVTADDGGEDALSTDTVIDGEVEDHQLTILGIDYGDAPVTTNGDYDDTDSDGDVDTSDNAARHIVVAGINLGTDPDEDTGMWGNGIDTNTNATDDDTPGDPAGGTDDEDGVSSITALATTDTSYSLTLTVNNGDASNAANVFAWVDFDRSGSFDEDERATVTGGVSSGGQIPVSTSGTVTLEWATVPSDIQSGNAYARVRITTDSGIVAGSDGGEDEAAFGLANNGEVEDYQVPITGVDFGDAPAIFGDAQHSFLDSQDFYIGAVIPDGEMASSSGEAADGDDTAGTDDEDADPSFVGLSKDSSGTFNVTVAVTNTGANATLAGWIDFDDSGTFEDDEGATVAANVTGNVILAFDVDTPDIVAGETHARFRITRQAITVADDTGSFSDGEVEDYSLYITGTDFGDAPVAYDNTAVHAIDGENIRLGSVAPDDDSGFWGDGIDDTFNATDDDTPNDPTGGVDDEDGINTATIPVLSSGADSYSVSLGLRNENTGSTAANIYAWIDFDGNNTFDEDERATLSTGTITPTTEGDPSDLSVPSAALTGSVDLDWTGIQAAGITAGTTYLRVRITTDDLDVAANGGSEDDASVGAATDGEIEDYQITIVANIDYGDAPVTTNNNYDDTTGDGLVNGSDDPARHNIVSGIQLGSAIDADSLTWGNGIDANGNASDDDSEGSAPDDEDGVTGLITIPVDQSAQYDLTVNSTSSGSAFVIGWIDFDQSGTFDEDERTSVTRGAGTSDVTLSWTSFPGLSLGATYARIRISSTDLASGSGTASGVEDAASTGLASDGEVEDYLVSVTGMDFGDVPVVSNGDYDDTNSDGSVTAADNAAEHAIDVRLYLGSVVADSEAPGQNTNGDATDDETNGTADEGISQLLTSGSVFPTLLPTTTNYSLTVDVANTTGTTANVYAWIDFDADKEFDEDERALATVNNGASTATLNWSNIGGSGPDIVNGATFLRFRITTNDLDSTTESSGVEDDASLGTATDGEVEDYAIAIGNFDFGDAPDLGAGQGTGDYRTLSVDDGPTHTISPTIYLGSTLPDLDSNGFEEGTDDSDSGSGGNATDDDNGGDEGLVQLLTTGSSFPALATGDAVYSLEVDMTNTSGGPVNLIAWIDFDQSGTFDEDEAALNTLLGNISSTILNWSSIPNDVRDGATYARFRITSNPQTGNDGSGEDERSYGSFSNGEVEDYQITLTGTDFGDAPSTYGTFDSGGGPKHGIDAGLYLGDTAPDGEGDAYGDGNDDNGDATDDDAEASADEGVTQLLTSGTAFPTYNITDGTYSLTIDAHKSIAGTATVQAWIDWDIDGDFDEDERQQQTITGTPGNTTVTLVWNIGGAGEPDQVVGSTYSRFRITTDTVAAGGSSDGQDTLALNEYSDGEVEDYAFVVEGDVNINGNIFEDINYGGGNGRSRSSALSDGGSNFGAGVGVELWDFDGSTCTAISTGLTGSNPVTTDALGQYSFTGVNSPATYCVRVVTSNLASTRTSTGAGNTEVAVQTFRSQSTDGNGTVAQIINEIGGRYPQDADSAALTFDDAPGDGTATHTWSQVITGASDINNLDFGYNFNTVVNTNDSGQGSLRQFMLNAEELSNTGLAQQSRTAGVDVSIFAIPTTDTGYNATGQNEFTIALASALPTISQEPIYIDGSTQNGTSCPTPRIEVTENGSGATDGFAITSGSSLLRGFIINGFTSGAAIDFATSGGNEVSCSYLGTNAAGTAAGNGGNLLGVDVASTSDSNTIGGAAATDANVIAGNTSDGLSLFSDSNTVTTNIIGLAADGLSSLGNGNAGIIINGANNQIGSTSSSDANTIAGNGGSGIEISASASNTANAIFINSIYNNGDTNTAGSNRTLGIDLNNDGITANDGATDSDTGANTLINFPVLGSITDAGSGNMDVPVTLSLPDGTYTVEFYANAVCNALQTGIEDTNSPNGEGQDFLQSTSIQISSGVQDITNVTIGTLGLVGNEVTAKVRDASGNTSEFSACQTVPTGVVPSATIEGTVFEDVNYGGGAGRDYTTANTGYSFANVGTQATVELWASDGNNCTGGSPLQAVTSNPTTGAYSFNTVNDTLFCVRIVNNTVQSNRVGWNSALVPVQTYRSGATDPTKAVGGESPRDADSAAGVYDAITGDGSATQSFSIIDVSGGNVAGVDFGFNFSTVVNTNSAGQGSLTQFVANANALGANTADKSGLDQSGLTTGKETSVFMVSNGAELAGLPSSIPNLLSGNSVAEITLSSDLIVTADDIILDGTTQTTNVGGNAATLGAGGTVGTQGFALSTLNGPEVQLEQGGIDIRGNDIEVRGFAMLPTTTAITINNGALNGHVIENNVIGASAISFIEPGSGSSGDLISIASATGNGTSGAPGTLGLIQNNLIGFGSGDGIALSSNATGWTITNNELQGFSGSGNAAVSLGTGVNNTNVRGNLIASSTYGIELDNSSGSNAADSIDENTIQNNSLGGIIIPATATSDGANDITQNIVSGNTGPGVILLTSQTNLISENSIFNNDGLAIDLGNDGVTNGVESGSAANEFLNIPDVTMADASDGTNLDITGTYTSTQASTPVTIELYSSSTCNPNSSGVAEGTDFGEGESFEGSTTVSGGNFNLSVLLSSLGTRRFITAIARDNDGNTSEFSQCEVGLTSDYGDAPNSYFTSEASGGPSHIRDAQIFIGTGVGGDGGVGSADIESDAAVSADATGDDSAGSDDEDGIDPSTDFSFLTSASENFSLTVDVYNNTGSTGNLVGWIDYDDSGTFDNDEVATVQVTSSTATGRTATLNWSSIPLDVLDGVTFARLRLTTDTSIATGTASTSSPIGPALDGEVEDYQITIAEGRDYGDAPDSYDTTIAAGGPSHVRNLQLYMGSVPPDGEFDGIDPGVDGDPVGDDNNGSQDDEDGVVLPGLIDSDTSYSVSVDVINTTGNDVTLHGWFDEDRNGTFETDEYTFVTLSGSTGSINDVALTWSSLSQPSVTGSDFTYVRVRLAPTSEGITASDWGGAFGDGEVEDYRVTVAELNCDTLYVHQGSNIGDNNTFVDVRSYSPSGAPVTTDIFSTNTTAPFADNIAGSSLDPITRRYYYLDRDDGSILYNDGSGPVDTTVNLTGSGNNYNRSGFTPDGVLWFLEGGLADGGPLAAYNISGTGLTQITLTDPLIDDAVGNAVNFNGTEGGDIAFDLDGNMYVLSYNGFSATEYYVWRIENLTTDPVAVFLRQSPGGSVPTGTQFAGAAFNTNDSLYLFGTNGDVCDWDLNTNAIDCSVNDSGAAVLDAASCIFPTLRPSLIVEKRVFNDTDAASPGFTPGDTLRYRITVENVGAFFADSTTFVDQIPTNSTYVQNSTTLNGNSVADNGGQMPYETAASINSPSGTTGIIEAGETATIEFQVLVDSGTNFTQVCNDTGIVEFTDVASASTSSGSTIQQGTDDPTTAASPTFPAVGGVTDDPTCSDKVSGYAISGTVYEDLNVDSIDDGSGAGENGISGVEVVLRNESLGTCQSTSTDVNGDYSFGPLDGGNYTLYEANGVSVPTPASCPPTTADPTGFESSTAQTISVLVTNDNVVDQDFGDVQNPNFSPSNSGTILPTNSVFYAHTFAPKSEGSVIFSFSEVTSPTNNGWSVTLYEDTACDGDFDVGDNVISNAITVTLTSNVPDDICILTRVTAPSDVGAGDEHIATVTATFTYGDGSAGIANEVLQVTDTTTTLSAGDGTMVLSKTVENISPASDFFDNGVPGTSNDAAPGDVLRYVITFQNISTSPINTIDIFDTVPSFTVLSDPAVSGGSDLLLDCRNDPQNDFTDGTGSLTCQIANPTGSGLIGHPPGYDGDLQWDIGGSLAPGASGSVSFTVEVE